jgi:hypothetical protein
MSLAINPAARQMFLQAISITTDYKRNLAGHDCVLLLEGNEGSPQEPVIRGQ